MTTEYSIIERDVLLVAGGAPGGLTASYDENLPAEPVVDINVPSGGDIIGVWYSLRTNIADISSFSRVEVVRYNSKQVKLFLGANKGKQVSVGIRIHALCKTG